MDCIDDWCRLTNFFGEHTPSLLVVLKPWLKLVGPYFEPLVNWIYVNKDWLGPLAGICFGIWRFWAYSEALIHRRLSNVIRREDARLEQAYDDLKSAIERPSVVKIATAPLFVAPALRSIFRARKLDDPALRIVRTERWVDSKLDRAEQQIHDRAELAARHLSSLNIQRKQTHLLRAALLSSRADGAADSVERNVLNEEALRLLRVARRLPGQSDYLWNLEFEAHQLRKTGEFGEATELYKELEQNLLLSGDSDHALRTLGRSKRYRAEIRQKEQISEAVRNPNATRGSLTAWRQMTSESADSQYYPGAVVAFMRMSHHTQWDKLEMAEMHLFSSFAASCLNYPVQTKEHLDKASDFVSEISRGTREKSWWSRRNKDDGPLRRRNKTLTACIADARQGYYREDWLLP